MSLEAQSSSDDDYYDEEQNLPIFKTSIVGLSSLKLTQIIVGGDCDPKYLCNVNPVAIQHNTVFIVDLKHVSGTNAPFTPKLKHI